MLNRYKSVFKKEISTFHSDESMPVEALTKLLPYAGFCRAYRFGTERYSTFDTRIGIGATTNADKISLNPVIKTGIGKLV